MRLEKMLLCGVFLFFAGCVSVPLVEEGDAFKSRTSQLEAELKRQKEENLSLRKQLEQAREAGVRMPTAKEIQTALKRAGFYQGEIDGQIGLGTKEAISKFQEAKGLNPDGAMGSRTWEILVKYLELE